MGVWHPEIRYVSSGRSRFHRNIDKITSQATSYVVIVQLQEMCNINKI
jgi:hypothetical protein